MLNLDKYYAEVYFQENARSLLLLKFSLLINIVFEQ